MRRSFLLAMLASGAAGGPALHAQMITRPDSGWVAVRAAIIRTNPGLVALRSGLAVATARIHAAGAFAPAELAAELEEGGRSTRIDLSRQLLDRGRSAERGVARADSSGEALGLEAAERQAVIEADRLLIQTATGFSVAARLAAEDSLLAAAEEALRVRFAVGGARYSDVLRLRAERLQVQSDRISQRTAAEASRLSLLALLTDSARHALVPAVDRAILRLASDSAVRILPEPPSADSVIFYWREVRSAEAGIAVAAAGLGRARAARTPALSASLGIQRYEAAAGYRLGPTIGATLTLPFTSAAPGRSQRVAELEVRQAEARRAAAVSEAQATAASALAAYRNARERLSIYDAALLRGARDEREAALAAFRTGSVSLVELLDFELALTRAEISRVETWAEGMDALAELLTGRVDHAQP